MHEQCHVNSTKKKNNENLIEQLCQSKCTRNSFTENMKFNIIIEMCILKIQKIKSGIFPLE